MRLLKPILFYFIFLVIVSIIFFSLPIFKESSGIIILFNNYLYLNLIFAVLLFFHLKKIKLFSIVVISIVAFVYLFFIGEVLIPKGIKGSDTYYKNGNKVENEKKTTKIELENILKDYIDRAENYLKIGEYSSAWIYADIYLDKGGQELKRAVDIKNNSESKLSVPKQKSKITNYLDNLLYKKYLDQKRYIDAYYFTKNKIDNSSFSYDLMIKAKSSYNRLLRDYYSIDYVNNYINGVGFTDISFYDISDEVKSFTIEKLSEYDGEFFLKNIIINDNNYPYLYINRVGKVFSKGFREGYREVILKEVPEIPVSFNNLKFYSKEYYIANYTSLILNLKFLSNKSIKYLKFEELNSMVIIKISRYLSLFVMFISCLLFSAKRKFWSLSVEFSISFILLHWFINRLGLILIAFGLGPAIILTFICYILWFIIVFFKTKTSLSRF